MSQLKKNGLLCLESGADSVVSRKKIISEYIREKTQSNKGSSVEANKRNVNPWLEVKAR